MFFEYISQASSNPCGQQRAFEGKSSFDLGFFLVSRPDVVGAGLQTHSLQHFPLSHFSFLFKYSLHSSCSSWFHSFPTAGMKHEASALIQSSHTLGVLTLNSPFPLSFSWELLETNPCRSNISLYYINWKDDQNGGENDMPLCYFSSLGAQRHESTN